MVFFLDMLPWFWGPLLTQVRENSPIQPTALHKPQTFCPDTTSEEENLEVGAGATTYSDTSCALHHSRERHSHYSLSCISSWFTLHKQPCPHCLGGTGQTGASNILGSISPSGMVLSPSCCDSLTANNITSKRPRRRPPVMWLSRTHAAMYKESWLLSRLLPQPGKSQVWTVVRWDVKESQFCHS